MFSASKTAGPSGYNINNSLRFRGSASAYLNRTPASATNRQNWTWSGWIKRGNLVKADDFRIFSARNISDYTLLSFRHSSAATPFALYLEDSATGTNIITTQVFRDPSAWYHIVIAIDTTQATAANRVKIYINGSQVTAFSTATYPTQNGNTWMNNTVPHGIGIDIYETNQFFDGYMAEINFIAGQQLTPSSFGSTNATTGVWQPAKYTGSYGTNGFYLPFSDIGLTSGSNTGLGKDFSGNSNYWTTNNISVTAGTTYDAMTDSPTLTSATVANYCVINPLRRNACTISNANLTASGPATFTKSVVASMSMPSGSGKYYWEAVFTRTSTTDGDVAVGIVSTTWNPGETAGSPSIYPGNTSDSWGVSGNSGNKINNASQTSYGSSFASGDIIMVAYDAVNGSFYVGKNGTWFNSGNPATNTNSAFTGITTEVLPGFGMAYDSGSSIVNANFGQRPFTYTPPTGFNRLNTFNLPNSTIVKGNSYMDATLYTGTNANLTITNAGAFKPDFVWIKSRSVSGNHSLFNSISGANKVLSSSLTMAEETPTAGTGLLSFNSNGFTLGADIAGVTGGETNGNGFTLVGWQWQAGQGSTSSNTSGSITSTVSVNTTAGFSVVTYTGTGANATVGHGLGVAPRMIIVKQRSGAGQNWAVYHASLTNTGGLALNLTNATITASGWWNNTSPTSSVFSLGGSTGSDWFTTNQSGSTYVAYCWAEIVGFSRFGSYTGNGSTDGPFVFTGFRPKFVMIKSSAGVADDWSITDTSRSTYNLCAASLRPNTSGAEDTNVGTIRANIDILSNGFKIRQPSDIININTGTYIYAAFAENPFKNALAR